MTSRLKAKDLRKKNDKELLDMMSQIDRELMSFRTAQNFMGHGNPPTRTGGSVMWGLFQTQKKNKAVILTVLTERRRMVKPHGRM